MKHIYSIFLFQLLATTVLLSQLNPVPSINQTTSVPQTGASQAEPKARARILDSYGSLPLSFETNHGQTDGQVKFLSRTSGYMLFLTGDEAVLELPRTKMSTPKASGGSSPKAVAVLRMKLRDANSLAKVTGVDEQEGTSNYFVGNDPAKWRTKVPTYAKVKYEEIYSGIDLVYYGNQRQLEYDFIVAPGADPHRIAFEVSGAKRIRRNESGDLILKMGDDEIRWHKPVVYQEKNGARHEIAARYVITDKNRVGFELAKYDANRPLYIDPLIYSTYLGGSGGDGGSSIAVDSAGNAYVTGATASSDFPTENPLQAANGASGADHVFVAKLNPTGSALVYSTYLGGSGGDGGSSIALDSAGNAYITGQTYSTDFPTTPGAFQTACKGGNCFPNSDGFVAKISPSGSALVYSTYLGGSGYDVSDAIAVDSSGNAYVTGYTQSTDFPTKNPFQVASGGEVSVFVAKLNPTGSALVYSTYLGGSADDAGYGIAVDSAGNAYVTGATVSTTFPTKNPLQATNGGGGSDAFVSKFNATGSALVYSTYLGGTDVDGGSGIAVDSAGNAYVTGATRSTDFPTTPGAFQTAYGGVQDAFVSKLNASGSALLYSTYLGGSGEDESNGIAVDNSGDAYVIGETQSTNFPILNPLKKRLMKPNDAFLSKLNHSGSALVYSTYLGGSGKEFGSGIALDSAGNAYVTGSTASTDFPTVNALQPTYGGGAADAFVAKASIEAGTVTTLSSSLDPSTYGQAVTFTAAVTSGLGPPPDGEAVMFMKGTKVLGTRTLSGGSASFTTSTLLPGTNLIDAVYGGDSTFAGSTSTQVKQVVNKATTTTTLTSSQNPSNFGQSVTFTASVMPQFRGKVYGTVTFYDGATALSTVPMSGGAAKFTTSTLASGAHNIMATYNGSIGFDGSSASLRQLVH